MKRPKGKNSLGILSAKSGILPDILINVLDTHPDSSITHRQTVVNIYNWCKPSLPLGFTPRHTNFVHSHTHSFLSQIDVLAQRVYSHTRSFLSQIDVLGQGVYSTLVVFYLK